jgi:pantoate--beta-alanine ligase
MIIIETTDELIKARDTLEGSVGFVPTMGALHEGHLSLIHQAKAHNERVIVSIFINPTQFLEGEDLDKYPKKIEADKEICKRAGVDILFMPTASIMYEPDELVIMAPAIMGYILEGNRRPGHFDGMLQVVMKLLNLTNPTNAYFGKKDAQQLALITQMARTYHLRTHIVPCDIVRSPQGLALSSRNLYLSPEEKQKALALSRSLKRATKMVMNHEMDALIIKNAMEEILESQTEIEYIAIVNRDFHPLGRVEVGNTIILVAAWVGATRLIDNLWI